jgi:hypothetical protein
VVVGDDEDALADPGPSGRRPERLCARERVTPLPGDGQIGELVDPEERGARNVLAEIRLVPGLDAVERIAAVDELVSDQ